MKKLNLNKLILFQRGELPDKEINEIRELLKKDKKLFAEYQKLLRADNYYNKYLDNFEMPQGFQVEINKRLKKKNKFKFLFNFNFLFNYGSGFATACFLFLFVSTIQINNEKNNSNLIRSTNNSSDTLKYLDNTTQTWLISKQFLVQLNKVQNNKVINITNDNNTLKLGEKIFIKILPLKNTNISIVLENSDGQKTIIEKLTLINGQEIQLPQNIIKEKRFFTVTAPTGSEKLLFLENNITVFELKYVVISN